MESLAFFEGVPARSLSGDLQPYAGFRIKPASNSRGKIADENRGPCDKKLTFVVTAGREHLVKPQPLLWS